MDKRVIVLRKCALLRWCVCVYLDKVMRAEVEEFQQLKVAPCRQDVLDHRWLQQDLSNGGRHGDRMRGQTQVNK